MSGGGWASATRPTIQRPVASRSPRMASCSAVSGTPWCTAATATACVPCCPRAGRPCRKPMRCAARWRPMGCGTSSCSVILCRIRTGSAWWPATALSSSIASSATSTSTPTSCLKMPVMPAAFSTKPPNTLPASSAGWGLIPIGVSRWSSTFPLAPTPCLPTSCSGASIFAPRRGRTPPSTTRSPTSGSATRCSPTTAAATGTRG